MIRTMKNSLVILFASILLCLVGATMALAVGSQDEVILDQQGDNVNVAINGIGSDVSAFSLTLVVDTTADTFDAVNVDFTFSDAINGATKIHKATIDTVDARCFVNLYVAGGSDLFAAKPLQVGTLKLSLDTQKSPGAVAVVSVPEGQALTTVSSGFDEEDAPVYLQSVPTINLGNVSDIENPIRPGGVDVNGDNGDKATYNPIQPIDDNSSSNRNSTTGADLARTGDQTPILPIVLIALACVAVLLAVVFFRKNSRKQNGDK